MGDGDKLMLHKDVGVGSQWRWTPVPHVKSSERGVGSAHVLESVRAPGWYLHLREGCEEQAGNALTVSQDVHSPFSRWHFQPLDPKNKKRGLLQSFVQGDVGRNRKFNYDGSWNPCQGWSVVSDVVNPSIFKDARALAQESSGGRECLSDTLPIDSLHMTVCGFDSIGEGKNHDKIKKLLDTFALEVKSSGKRFEACKVTVRPPKKGLNMQLQIGQVEPKAPFDKLRDGLKRLTREKKDEPADGKLHVNQWYWLYASHDPAKAERSLEKAQKAVEAVLKKNNGRLPLSFPHLANYPHMASFPKTLCQSAVPEDSDRCCPKRAVSEDSDRRCPKRLRIS